MGQKRRALVIASRRERDATRTGHRARSITKSSFTRDSRRNVVASFITASRLAVGIPSSVNGISKELTTMQRVHMVATFSPLTLLIRFRSAAYVSGCSACNSDLFPCLLAGDRYKIAVETRPRSVATLFRIPRRDLIANECGGVTVSLHRRLIQFTRRRYHDMGPL